MGILDAPQQFAPVGLGLIAFATNRSDVITTGPTASEAAITGCVVAVPPTTRDVWLEYGATIGIATPGQGYTKLTVWDITSGFAGGSPGVTFIRSYSNEIVTATKARLMGIHRVGPSTTLRTFMLTIKSVQEGSSLSGYAVNSSTVGNATYLAAVGR